MGDTEDHEARPWGEFFVLSDGPSHKVKRIVVRPGQRLSYQRHHRRSEHWFVVAGSGVVTLHETEREVAVGQSVDIPVGVAHRVQALHPDDLVFIEVQHGDFFGEDGIIRLDDDYGRTDPG